MTIARIPTEAMTAGDGEPLKNVDYYQVGIPPSLDEGPCQTAVEPRGLRHGGEYCSTSVGKELTIARWPPPLLRGKKRENCLWLLARPSGIG